MGSEEGGFSCRLLDEQGRELRRFHDAVPDAAVDVLREHRAKCAVAMARCSARVTSLCLVNSYDAEHRAKHRAKLARYSPPHAESIPGRGNVLLAALRRGGPEQRQARERMAQRLLARQPQPLFQ